MLQVVCIRDARQLTALQQDWDRLSLGLLMRRYRWLMSWWDAYQSTHQLNVLVAYREGAVCGIMPLAETYSAWAGQTLVFMGSGKVCSDDMGILALPADAEEVAEAFANYLAHPDQVGGWDHLNLDGIRDENETMHRFRVALIAQTETECQCKESPNCWAASLAGDLQDFQSRMTKRARKLFRDAKAEVDSGRSAFEVAQTLEQALEFAQEIRQLHQMRWREKGIRGCFSEQRFTDFVDNAIRSLWVDELENQFTCADDRVGSPLPQGAISGKQRVVVTLLKIDGKPAAGSICFRDRDALDVYLTGMNPEYGAVRPGWQLNTCCIDYAIELGCKRFDFLRGDEEYKERLGGVPSVQRRWLIASPRFSSKMRNAAYRVAVQVRQWWKKPIAT